MIGQLELCLTLLLYYRRWLKIRNNKQTTTADLNSEVLRAMCIEMVSLDRKVLWEFKCSNNHENEE